MAILAVYPQAKNIQFAIWDNTLSENTTLELTSDRKEIIENQLLPWLKNFNIVIEDLQLVITRDYAAVHSPFMELLAKYLAVEIHVVKASRFSALALVTGTPDILRKCEADTFIFEYLVDQEARRTELDLPNEQFIVAHLDEEIQLGALIGTNIVDALTSLDEGPFALYHSGGLPFDTVLDLSLELQDKDLVHNVLQNEGGFAAYLGSASIKDVWQRQDEQAKLIHRAFAYQVSKEIGALATVLHGRVRSIILAGELVKHEPFVHALETQIGFIAPISVYPGNQGLPALLEYAQKFLREE